MLAGTTQTPKPDERQDGSESSHDVEDSEKPAHTQEVVAPTTSTGDLSAMIRIKRTYNFAGRVHTEEKIGRAHV